MAPLFSSSAQLGEQIFFPALSNTLRVLPGEMDYEVQGSQGLTLGGRVFQASDIDLQLISSTQTLKFKWKSLPLKKIPPLLTLRDNTGRIVWSKSLEPGSTHFSLDAGPENILPLLQSFPFFRFCANYEIESSQAFICSKDYFLSEKQKTYQLRARALKTVFHPIEINGHPGGPRGKFFLSNGREPLYLKAYFDSGPSLEFFLSPPQLTIRDVRGAKETGEIHLKIDSNEGSGKLSPLILSRDKNETLLTHGLGPEIRQFFEVLKPPVDSKLILSVRPSQRTLFYSDTKFNIESNSDISLSSKHPQVRVDPVSKKQFKVEVRDIEAGGPRVIPFDVAHQGQTYVGHLILQKEDLVHHRASLLIPGMLEYRALSTDKLPWQILSNLEVSLVNSTSSLNSSGVLLAAGLSNWTQKLSDWTLFPALSFRGMKPQDEDQIQSFLMGLAISKGNLSSSWYADIFELNLLPFSASGNESLHIKARLLSSELATDGMRIQVQGAFAEYSNNDKKTKSKSELAIGLSISF